MYRESEREMRIDTFLGKLRERERGERETNRKIWSHSFRERGRSRQIGRFGDRASERERSRQIGRFGDRASEREREADK